MSDSKNEYLESRTMFICKLLHYVQLRLSLSALSVSQRIQVNKTSQHLFYVYFAICKLNYSIKLQNT